MQSLALLSAALPAVTAPACWLAIRPTEQIHGALRLTTIKTVLVVAAYAEVCVELLSLMGWLTPSGVRGAWLVGLTAAVAVAVIRQHRSTPPPSLWSRPNWPRLRLIEWLMVLGLAVLGASTLLVALVAEPNNYDSQAYHLPKVAEWAQRGSVELYPTSYYPQATSNPGAEYLLLHLRLLTDGDALFNLVQWTSGVLCVVGVSWIAGRLGARRSGQLAAGLAFAAAPAVVCQATSTQNDLVAAAWAVCVTVLVLDSARRRLDTSTVLLLGLATGLAWATKNTSAVVALPMMALWFLARAAKVRSLGAGLRLVGASLAITAVAGALIGPFMARMVVTYGHPLGPAVVREHALGRHDPAGVIVNGAMTFQTALMVPGTWVNNRTTHAVEDLAKALEVDINDLRIIKDNRFPMPAGYVPDEDFASTPSQVVMIGAGLIYCLIWRRRNLMVVMYAATCLVVAVAFCASIKWQWWGNRFLLPWYAVGVPLAGLAADALAQATVRRTAAMRARGLPALAGWTTATLALLSAVLFIGFEGTHSVLYAGPRPLHNGTSSVLTMSGIDTRFARTPTYRPDYEWAVARIRESGAYRIGLDLGEGQLEYPWWVMLPDRELVQLTSVVPGHPAPPVSSVDAIVCLTAPTKECATLSAPGWTVETKSVVSLTLAPHILP